MSQDQIEFEHFNEGPGHQEDGEEGPYWFVLAIDRKTGGDLCVAQFPYDSSHPEAEHYKEQARLMAVRFAELMNREQDDR